MNFSPRYVWVTFSANCDNCVHHLICERQGTKGHVCLDWRMRENWMLEIAENVRREIRSEIQRREEDAKEEAVKEDGE